MEMWKGRVYILGRWSGIGRLEVTNGWLPPAGYSHCTLLLYKPHFSSFPLKARSHERMNHRNSVASRLALITDNWATSDCVFQHSATVNRKRLWSSLCERRQNDEILPNSSNHLFKWAIPSLRQVTDCQILNMFKVNRWLPWLCNSVAATGSCMFTQVTAWLAFLWRQNRIDSVARVNRPLVILNYLPPSKKKEIIQNFYFTKNSTHYILNFIGKL